MKKYIESYVTTICEEIKNISQIKIMHASLQLCDDAGNVETTQPQLAATAELSRRATQRNLSVLYNRGYLTPRSLPGQPLRYIINYQPRLKNGQRAKDRFINHKLDEAIESLMLPPGEQKIMKTWASFAHKNTLGRNIFPTLEKIAATTGMSVREVRSITRWLVKIGLMIHDPSCASPNGQLRDGYAIANLDTVFLKIHLTLEQQEAIEQRHLDRMSELARRKAASSAPGEEEIADTQEQSTEECQPEKVGIPGWLARLIGQHCAEMMQAEETIPVSIRNVYERCWRPAEHYGMPALDFCDHVNNARKRVEFYYPGEYTVRTRHLFFEQIAKRVKEFIQDTTSAPDPRQDVQRQVQIVDTTASAAPLAAIAPVSGDAGQHLNGQAQALREELRAIRREKASQLASQKNEEDKTVRERLREYVGEVDREQLSAQIDALMQELGIDDPRQVIDAFLKEHDIEIVRGQVQAIALKAGA